MKNIFLLSAILISSAAFGQKAISVTEAKEQINNSSNNSLSVIIYDGKADDVKKAWKKALKDLKGKVSEQKVEGKKEFFADDCELKSMGDNTFDVYSRVDEVASEGAKLIVAVDLGGAYLNSEAHAEQFKVIRDLVYNFGVEQNKAVVGEEIELLEKALKDLEKELEDLEKDDQKLDKQITDAKAAIKAAEAAKVTNANNRAAKAAAIASQKETVKETRAKQAAIK